MGDIKDRHDIDMTFCMWAYTEVCFEIMIVASIRIATGHKSMKCDCLGVLRTGSGMAPY